MEKRIKKLINKSFKKTLLDSPVPNKKVKFSLRGNKSKLETIKLPEPLKPTKAKPIPKPRVKSKKPVPLPRLGLLPRRGSLPRRKPSSRPRPKAPKPIDIKVKRLINEIAQYYKPEAIQKFKEFLKDKKNFRDDIITKMKKALRRAVQSLQVAILDQKDPSRQLYFTKLAVANELESIFNRYGAMKVNISLNVDFIKNNEDANGNFNSEDFTILDPVDIIDFLDRGSEKILNIIAGWVSKGSGWTIKKASGHFINIVKYLPLRGNSYIKLPLALRNSMKGLINLQNKDDKCFLWAHVRYLNPRKKKSPENNKR